MDIKLDAIKALGEDFKYSGFEIAYSCWSNLNRDATDVAKGKFLHDFAKGFFNRPSIRTSNQSRTVADPLVLKLLEKRICCLEEKDAELIGIGHRIAMASENIIGAILEEYIHDSLINFGWSACWGSCIRAVDFCSQDGILLQVKNKSNTENSSSNKIRNNTEIRKWYRFNASNGDTKWDEINRLTTGENIMTEETFQLFALNLIKNNPLAINVRPEDEKFIKSYIAENRSSC